jgi:hypothetical protein
MNLVIEKLGDDGTDLHADLLPIGQFTREVSGVDEDNDLSLPFIVSQDLDEDERKVDGLGESTF